MPRKNISVNPYLSEYIYDLLWNVTDEERKKISRKYWFILKSATRSRNFADFSTLEEKMRLCSELGIEYALVFTKDKIANTESLKKVMSMYAEDKKAGAIKELSQLKVFVSTDRDLSFLLSLMSASIHQKTYYLNQQLNKLGYSLKNWDKNLVTPEGKELRETIDSTELIDKTLFNCALTIDFVKNVLDIDPFDMKVILYLNTLRRTYIQREHVIGFFKDFNPKKIGTSLKRLLVNGYISKYPEVKTFKYTITEKGIKTVSDFRQLVIKYNNF